jgi:hypothetical protein
VVIRGRNPAISTVALDQRNQHLATSARKTRGFGYSRSLAAFKAECKEITTLIDGTNQESTPKQRPGGVDAEPTLSTVTLTAGPFTRAGQLRRFLQEVTALRGMRETAILALEQQMLSLELRYADAMPLLQRLQTLSEFQFDVEEEDQDSITVRLRDPTANSP